MQFRSGPDNEETRQPICWQDNDTWFFHSTRIGCEAIEKEVRDTL